MDLLCDSEKEQESELFRNFKIGDLKSRVFLLPLYLFMSWH